MNATLRDVFVGLLVLAGLIAWVTAGMRIRQDRHEFLTHHCERIGETGRGVGVYRCDGGDQ